MAGRAPTSEHARRGATAIVEALRARGHTAYFAGGCVRDELLGLMPSDYDVATDATPERVRSLFPHSDLVGACFGVVIVKQRIAGEMVIVEVATFRSDGAYTDSRRPDTVTFSTPEADAARRDFTVNALFLDPSQEGTIVAGRRVSGRVIDFVGGVADLEARVLRAVGVAAQRLAEDHLRALRGVRLAAKLRFRLDPATAEAIRRDSQELRGVSRERIGDEVRRMLVLPARTAAMEMLKELGLEGPVLARTDRSGEGLSLMPDRHRPGLVLEALGPDVPAMLALGAWALDLGATLTAGRIDALTREFRAALCLSNEERDELRHVLNGLRLLRDEWTGWGVARRKRFVAGPACPPGLALLASIDQARAAATRDEIATLEASPGGIAPAPLVTGDDLVAAGWAPGPLFKGVLDGVYDAQLEGRVTTREGAMELARTLGVYK